MSVIVHIERLVLDGLDLSVRQAAQLRAAFEVELLHLLSTRGLPAGLESGAVHVLQAAPLQTAGGGPVNLGRQIAHSMYGGLAK